MKTSDQKFKELLKRPISFGGDLDIDNDGISNRAKTFVKRWPGLYNFLRETFGATHSPGNKYNLKTRLKKMIGDDAGKVVLNLGSGTNRLHPDVLNVDIFAFKNVDIVADITDTPFKDNTVDGVVCDSVMEHIANTSGALREISRIMKPGGIFILTSLYMYPYHSSPNDYYRWTEEGMRQILKENNFSVEERGIHGGPMGALQGVLMHIFATIFSFGSRAVYFILVQFFMVLFAPLKLLDPLLMLFPYSTDAASDIYIIAKKNN